MGELVISDEIKEIYEQAKSTGDLRLALDCLLILHNEVDDTAKIGNQRTNFG